MPFDFDKVTLRRGTNAYKWDAAPPAGSPEGVIPLWVADMDFPTAPCIIQALRERVEHGIFGYTQVPESYYQSIIRWFSQRHGWHIERDWIQYTSGVVPALSAVIKALVQPGEKVIVQTPVYKSWTVRFAMKDRPTDLISKTLSGNAPTLRPACCCSATPTTRPAGSGRRKS